MLMRRVMVTMNSGGKWIPPNVMWSHMAAASRWGAQYVQLTGMGNGDPFVIKSRALAELADSFAGVEQVMWIDGDVLIRHDCESIFDLVPIDHFGGVPNFQGDTHNGIPPVNQTRLAPGMITQIVGAIRGLIEKNAARSGVEETRTGVVDAYMDREAERGYLSLSISQRTHIGLLFELEQRYDPETFINGGLFVFSPAHHGGIFDILKGTTDHMDAIDPADEQGLLNAAILLSEAPLQLLDRTYNRVGEAAWKSGPMSEKVQHLAHFRWNGTDTRLYTPQFDGDKTELLQAIDWRQTA